MPMSVKSEVQRCQLTVMFCDLVGSATLSEQFAPEELWQVLSVYQEACAEVIEPLAGYIAQYLGDGILVYFGYPTANTDDAYRAVRAGLEILAAMKQLNNRLRIDTGIELAVRMRIHTGVVVVAEVGRGNKLERLAIGKAPNIAARLQGLAVKDSVVLSAVTHQMVQGYFECHSLGWRCLKGISHPMEVYQVVGSC